MKPVFNYLTSLLLISCITSVYSQNTIVPKDIYGQNVLSAEGKRINYSESQLKVAKLNLQKSPALKVSENSQSNVVKSQMDAETDNMYSIMGTSIGRNSMHSLDIDNDGNVELICSATTQGFGIANFWYIMRYDATDSSWNQIWTSPLYSTNIQTLEVVDFNNDNNYQILLGFTDGTIQFYDPVTKTLIKSVKPISEPVKSIVYADGDNDSTKDIIVSGTSNTYILDATTLAQKTVINKGANYVRVGKLDDSGKNEIVLSSGYIYKLDGGTLTNIWNFNTSGEGYVELSDIDSDTKQEVVFAQSWYYIYVYDVDTKTTKYGIKSDLDINALTLSDVNNDGVDEILYGDGQWGSVYCHNAVTQQLMWSVPNPEHGVTAINFADLNNDGRKELIWGAGWTSTGSDYLYIYDVAGNKLLWRSDDIDGPFYAVATGDVDGDGKDEVVAVSYESESGYDSGIILIMDAKTNKLKWKCNGTFLYGAWEGLYNVSISDVDNDGVNEIIIAADQTYTGKIWIVDGINHTIKSSHLFSSENIDELHGLTVNDIDNDGQKELIATSSNNMYVINPISWLVKWSVNFSNYSSNSTLRCADINGDGNKEIVLCRGNIQIVNSIDHSFWTSTETNYTNIDLFDFNNDGILDIVASTSNGHIVIIDGNSKLKLSDINPENTSISSVRAYKNNNLLFYIYSCDGKINILQNDNNCSVSNYLGTPAGAIESLQLYNEQASSTEILIGTPVSVLKMYFNVLSVSSNNIVLDSDENSTASLDISTEKNWKITNSASWLSVNNVSGSGNSTVTLTAQANPSGEKRSTTLTISDPGSNTQTITVTQNGAAPVLNISKDSLTISALMGSTNSFDVTSNMNWTAVSNQSWLSVNKTSGYGNTTLTLTAISNPTITPRIAIVTITVNGLSPKTIIVTQVAGAAYLSVSSYNLTVAAQANSSNTFVVLSNISWNVSSNQNWLTVSPATGSNSGTVTITAQASQITTTRSATITVAGSNGVSNQTINVIQSPGVAALSVSTNTVNIDANNLGTFDILSNTEWSISSNQSWLNILTTSGSGNTTINMIAQKNTTGKIRAAAVVIVGTGVSLQAISVIQDIFNNIDETSEDSLLIFPNPVVDEIILNNINESAIVSVYDLYGKLLLTKQATSTTLKIDLSNVLKGIYTIRITDGKSSKTRKFIKQ